MIFCTECRYLDSCSDSGGGSDSCKHPDNIILHYNWRQQWTGGKRHPKKINKHNDCGWFEKRVV